MKIEELKNKIFCADCLGFMPEIPDKSIDMILADLPYGTTACKWDTIIPFEPLWEQYRRIIKDNGAIVLTASQPFTSALVMSNIKWFKYEWIWDKITAKGHLVAKLRPLAQHENILVFGNGKIKYNPIMVNRDKKVKSFEAKRTEIMGGRSKGYKKEYTQWYPKTILTFSIERGFHPTQKPVALFEYLIKTYTNEGDLVLDNVIGSGTTAVAAINTKRNFIGMEKDENYYKIAQERINNLPVKLF